MAERGIAPTEEVYRNAIHCYGILGRADRAALVFQRMLAAGMRPGVATYSALINAYADSCMPEQVSAPFLSSTRCLTQGRQQLWTC